jgi:hypothetical protein
MSKSPSPVSSSNPFLNFLRLLFPVLVLAVMIACGGSSSSPRNVGGGGGGSRTVNDMLFAADFNNIATHAAGWCPTDSAGNVGAVTTLRIWDSGMKWADIETASGSFDWSKMDLTVNTLATNPNCAMSVIYTHGNTPIWASACAGQADPSPCLPGPTSSGYGGGTQCAPGTSIPGTSDFSCTPPSDIAADGTGTDLQFQTFVNALVTRYAGKIAYYEVWNEADSPNFWCPDPSGGSGAPATCAGSIPRMIRMGWDEYNIVHCVDPTAKVLSPSFHGFSSAQGGWMNLYSTQTSISAPAGSIGNCSWAANPHVTGKQTFDITNFHGRGSPTSDPTGFLAVYNVAVGEINRDGLPTPNGGFFDDENGYIGSADAPTVDLQAAYVSISYVLRASVTNPSILLSGWYAWDSGQAPLQGTDAGLAYDVTAGWLSGSTLTGGCSVAGNTVYSCSGTTSKGKPFTIMWDMGQSQSCMSTCLTSNQPLPSAAYTTWTDLKGNLNQISGGSVPVGYKPVLIE